MSEKGEFTTIGQFFENFLDNKKCRIIKVIPKEIWAKSTKQQARLKIYLPEEICSNDTRELRKWFLTLVAIPREEIKK